MDSYNKMVEKQNKEMKKATNTKGSGRVSIDSLGALTQTSGVKVIKKRK